VLRLKNEGLEHQNRVEGRTPAFGAIAITKALNQPGPEIFKVHRRSQNLKGIAVPAQLLKMITKTEKTAGIHDGTSKQALNHNSNEMTRFLRVSILAVDPVNAFNDRPLLGSALGSKLIEMKKYLIFQ